MTEEKLNTYIFLNKEIKDLDKVIENLNYGQPIHISVGDSDMVTFSAVEESNETKHALRKNIREFILRVITEYRDKLVVMFNEDKLD